jgi:hypothetical protein
MDHRGRRTVLIAGGDADPDLATLAGTLKDNDIPHETLFVGPRTHPRITWDFESDALRIDGEERRPEALFIRYDVFSSMADSRPAPTFRSLAWFTAVSGWAIAHPEVKMFNRRSALHVTNKLHVLHVAREVGLDIPRTLVTNDHALLVEKSAREPLIAKPVNGGDYTRELSDILKTAPQREGSLPAPSFVQERLVPREVRVYSIGGRYFAFQLVADALDYRSTSDCQVLPLDDDSLPASLYEGLGRLMERLQMDYGAADFKADPETGALRFLEINNGPMFTAFDRASGGRLSRAMAEHLSAS